MNIENKYPVMIFKNIYDNKELYNLGLNKKDINGNYINGTISCKFKKGVSLDNQTKIYIKNAWLDFYKKNKVTVPFIFINEFVKVEEQKEEKQENDPFANFGQLIEDDLLD